MLINTRDVPVTFSFTKNSNKREFYFDVGIGKTDFELFCNVEQHDGSAKIEIFYGITLLGSVSDAKGLVYIIGGVTTSATQTDANFIKVVVECSVTNNTYTWLCNITFALKCDKDSPAPYAYRVKTNTTGTALIGESVKPSWMTETTTTDFRATTTTVEGWIPPSTTPFDPSPLNPPFTTALTVLPTGGDGTGSGPPGPTTTNAPGMSTTTTLLPTAVMTTGPTPVMPTTAEPTPDPTAAPTASPTTSPFSMEISVQEFKFPVENSYAYTGYGVQPTLELTTEYTTPNPFDGNTALSKLKFVSTRSHYATTSKDTYPAGRSITSHLIRMHLKDGSGQYRVTVDGLQPGFGLTSSTSGLDTTVDNTDPDNPVILPIVPAEWKLNTNVRSSIGGNDVSSSMYDSKGTFSKAYYHYIYFEFENPKFLAFNQDSNFVLKVKASDGFTELTQNITVHIVKPPLKLYVNSKVNVYLEGSTNTPRNPTITWSPGSPYQFWTTIPDYNDYRVIDIEVPLNLLDNRRVEIRFEKTQDGLNEVRVRQEWSDVPADSGSVIVNFGNGKVHPNFNDKNAVVFYNYRLKNGMSYSRVYVNFAGTNMINVGSYKYRSPFDGYDRCTSCGWYSCYSYLCRQYYYHKYSNYSPHPLGVLGVYLIDKTTGNEFVVYKDLLWYTTGPSKCVPRQAGWATRVNQPMEDTSTSYTYTNLSNLAENPRCRYSINDTVSNTCTSGLNCY